MKRFLFFALILTAALASCKKDRKGSDLDRYRDTVYAYAQEVYLWNDAIPGSFDPKSYTSTSNLAALRKEVDAISQFKINPTTNKPYEYDPGSPGSAKYSGIDEGQSATAIGGTGGDLGFTVFYSAYNDLRIKYVQPNSSAAQKGLVRGYKVLAVNDNANINYDPNSADPNNDPNLVRVANALSGNTIRLTLQKPDNSLLTVDVAKTTYTINPVLKYSTVTTAGGKVVGYFAFSRFTTPANAKPEIDKAFNEFISKGVTELVVDLRYNGGGSVVTSEYLANYIVPPSKNGTLMYTETYNARMQSGNVPFLKKKFDIKGGEFSLASNSYNFKKIGTLNLNRVFFLVTGNTASASELLINNLKPVMNVQIIGRTTYGKPVGFFGLPVGPYDLYLAMFESRNADNQADFYQGMVPGSASFPGLDARDDVTKDFGDPTELYFASALNFINRGNYTQTALKSTMSTSSADQHKLTEANSKLDPQGFNGMTDERLQRMIKN